MAQEDVRLELSDHSQLLSLQRVLCAVPTINVERLSAKPEIGHLGIQDILAITGSGAAILAAVKVLPDFLRARRSDLSVKITRKGETVEINAKNASDVMPILETVFRD